MSVDVEAKLATEKTLADYEHRLALELERVRDHYTRNQDGFRLGMADAKASMKATVRYGLSALRGAFILNAGGAVGAASFLSAAVHRTNASELAFALMSLLANFALGAVLPVVATGITYVAQYRHSLSVYADIRKGEGYAKTEAKIGHWWRYVAIACMIASCACFVGGMVEGFGTVGLAVRLP
jgi:hypothetical protein